jgi:hypothetical protein
MKIDRLSRIKLRSEWFGCGFQREILWEEETDMNRELFFELFLNKEGFMIFV